MTVAFLPILLAGFSSVIIGWLWYHPNVFGTHWMRMTTVTPEMAERGTENMWLTALVALISSMLAAAVMSYFGVALHIGDWINALELGFFCWIGFAAPVMLGSVIWDHKPFSLFLINALYWLVSFLVMASVLLYASTLFVGGVTQTSNDTSSVTSG